MAKIIDGKAISAEVRAEIRAETEKFTDESGITPGLAVIIVGSNPASQVYVRNKKRACEEVGFFSSVIEMPETVSEEALLIKIAELNSDEKIHGILVQLPLPKHISEEKVILAIDPKKDVDAFHPYNVGRIVTGDFDIAPCTPSGVMELLRRSGITVRGKECVIAGRSNIVGKPMALLMLAADATVTVCHSKTENLAQVCRRADILITAIGNPKLFGADTVKDGAVVIDVGINRTEDGKLCGDVDFDAVLDKVSAITPVPGGVGPMTITMLLRNTLSAAKKAVKQ